MADRRPWSIGCDDDMGYLEIGIIFVGAMGAALFLGTGAALLRYRRTGAFPGQPPDADPARTAGAVRGSVFKLVLGGVLVAVGVRTLFAVGAFS